MARRLEGVNQNSISLLLLFDWCDNGDMFDSTIDFESESKVYVRIFLT